MQTTERTITKEQFSTMLGMSKADRWKFAENNIISEWERYGYGFYGVLDVYEKDGEYKMKYYLGSTCD